ncbi:uncharacterized protein N7506_000153 [Penicillium brevicompactum]|uniref:uncharacterized protein n=1 Tax=Penicillium brevicompactum TaxID=5074 RepID=UPI002540F69A|nr:uncharacterized protein N7506_000153 [Penicillium brevicompactum]KAJ5346900.1 hypothetical protein N7506_000153 [Penicillium brevicompactum]
MPEDLTTAVELLDNIGTTVNTIAGNLGANRLDRRSFRKYLCDYADRAASDGQLINASRKDTPQCANRGLLLAYAHMEMICWIAKNNYTILSTSVKWYSWRKVCAKYRLPLLGVSPQNAHLTRQLQNIKKIADQVYAEIDAKNIPVLQDSVKYRKVSVRPPVDPQPGMGDLVHRATLAHKQLSH